MYAQVEKPKENKSRAVANSVGQEKSNVKQRVRFVDNRPSALVQVEEKKNFNQPVIKGNLNSVNHSWKTTFSNVIQRVINGVGIKCIVGSDLTTKVSGGKHNKQTVKLGNFRNKVNPGDELICTIKNDTIIECQNLTQEKILKRKRRQELINAKIKKWLSDNRMSVSITIAKSAKKHTTASDPNTVIMQIRNCLGSIVTLTSKGTRINKGTYHTFIANIRSSVVSKYVVGADKGRWTIVGGITLAKSGQKVHIWHHGPAM